MCCCTYRLAEAAGALLVFISLLIGNLKFVVFCLIEILEVICGFIFALCGFIFWGEIEIRLLPLFSDLEVSGEFFFQIEILRS